VNILALGVVLLGAKSPATKVFDLRTEYMTSPLGLDVPQPRLSWLLAPTRPGLSQRDYEIQAASTETSLLANRANLWQTGMVRFRKDSGSTVEYAGKPLTSGQMVWWRVRVKDDQDKVSPWSAPAHWSVGYLNPSDWHAKWIGTTDFFNRQKKLPKGKRLENTVQDPWLRREFDLKAKPSQALMSVASVGYHELYVNGVRASQAVLEPAVSDHKERALYVTYDIARLLKPGRNVVALWLGVSWSIFPPYQSPDKPATPIVMAQADLRFPDRSHQTIATDETWLTHPSPNRLLGTWDFTNYGGEEYDARREVPGWNQAGLDTFEWKPAEIYHPHLKISSANVELNRRGTPFGPKSIEATTDGAIKIDMGRNFAGWVQFPIEGKPGDRILVEFSEKPNDVQSHRLHSEFVIGATGQGVFCNRFNYMSGRWVTIHGLRKAPDVKQITGCNIHTGYDSAATFTCDDPLLQGIYDMCQWTWESLSLGGYSVDCPQRERMGYGGDAHGTVQTALDMYQMGAFYTKWAQDWRDVQTPDGNLPYTAPTQWGGGGPIWSGFSIFMPWQVYIHYGDTRILRDNLPMMRRLLAFWETKSRNNLMPRWGGDWDYLGDWLWPNANGSVNGGLPETEFLNNAYWVYSLDSVAWIDVILGHMDEATKYRARANEIRQAAHAKFYRPATHDYATGTEQYLAAALLANIPPPLLRPQVEKRLDEEILTKKQGHIDAGITGGALLTRYLIEAGRADLLYAMATKTDFPSWGDFIKNGYTTFPEEWRGGDSYLHSSFEFVGAWFVEGFLGIQPISPGYRYLNISPLFEAPTLRHVKASYRTPYGWVGCAWDKVGTTLRCRITVPPNSKANFSLPAPERSQPTQNGHALRGAPKAGKLDLELGPGTYDFRTTVG